MTPLFRSRLGRRSTAAPGAGTPADLWNSNRLNAGRTLVNTCSKNAVAVKESAKKCNRTEGPNRVSNDESYAVSPFGCDRSECRSACLAASIKAIALGARKCNDQFLIVYTMFSQGIALDMFGPFGAGERGIERLSPHRPWAASTADLKPDVDVPLMVAETGERANRQNENCPPLADKIDRERKPAVIAGCQKN
jgi:hypothetical protein